jgi:hypothetical protein
VPLGIQWWSRTVEERRELREERERKKHLLHVTNPTARFSKVVPVSDIFTCFHLLDESRFCFGT